jgi:hypothetical protein
MSRWVRPLVSLAFRRLVALVVIWAVTALVCGVALWVLVLRSTTTD